MTLLLSKQPSEWRFLQLTLVIAVWMLLTPYVTDRWLIQLFVQLFLLNCVLVTLWANPEWSGMRRGMILLWAVSLAASLAALVSGSSGWQRITRIVDSLTFIPLLGVLAAGILRFVFRTRRLTVDGVFATIVAYLLVAVLFAQLYAVVAELDPQSFNVTAAATARPAYQVQNDLLYFSFVTLATLGYGDVLPLAPVARTLATFEAVVGQFYVAVLVAVFVGMYSAQRND